VDERAGLPLHAGSSVVYDGQAWDVAELAPPGVLLERPGELRRVSIGHLLAAPGTRLGDAAPGGAGGGLLAGLDGEGLAEVRDRAAHVREACTGYRSGSPELALPGEPRSEYGAGANLVQRYRAKAAELGVSERTVRRWAAELEASGPEGLVDARRLRRRAPAGGGVCQILSDTLGRGEHGAPVDYARRRRLRRFSQARLDTAAWRRQRYFLTHPATWAQRRHLDHARPPAAPVQEQLARLRLIELLTGTHPRYLPGPLRLPERRSQDYAEFVFTMPGQMASCLHQQARTLLSKAGISEPVTWEPPFDWATGIPWPGPDPDTISTEDLHPLIRAGLPVRAIAARLATSADHVRLAAARHPAPRLPSVNPAPPPPEPEPPGTEQLRDLTSQGYGPRKIARITGYSERAIRQLVTSAGLRHPAPLPDGGIDPHWLREHYQDRQRSLKDIAAETGVPVEALAAAARKAGIRVRHGIDARAHPLAALGGPGAFPADVWNVFTRPGAEQRIRRLLALPGQPGLQHAARQLGIRTAMLTSQVNQLETTVGTALLRTGPDGRLTLTAYGQLFARDVAPVLKMLTPP
jgi:Helix-turn-helix domain/Bacterial regulatory helix-turn-helix protein, lysR family